MSGKMYSLLEPDAHIIDDSIRFYDNHQAIDFPQHRNMAYEMVMPVQNIYSMRVDGDEIILQPNDLLIIPSGIIHEITAPPTGRRFIIMLDRDRLFSVDGLLQMERCFYPYMLVRAGSSVHTGHFLAAVSHYNETGILSHTASHLELSMMLVGLLRQFFPAGIKQDTTPQTKKDQRQLLFSDISNYVANHCTDPLSSQELAKSAGYSRFYFERLFEEYMSMSFHQFLVLKRIEFSKRLLLLNNDAVTQVAHQSGFSSIATFNRVFRKQEGMSPSEFRIHNKK